MNVSDNTKAIFEKSPLFNGLMEAVSFLTEIEESDDPSKLPELFSYIDSDHTDPAVKSASKDLAEKLIKGREHYILYGLKNGGPVTRQICIASAGEAGLENAVEPLLEMLDETREPLMIQGILGAFEHIRDERAKKTASLFVNDKDPLIAVAAVNALKNSIGDDYKRLLALCLESVDPMVALSVAKVLGELGGDLSVKALAKNIHHDHPTIRMAVAASLIMLGSASLKPLYQKVLSDDIGQVASAITILGEIGNPDAVAPLKPLCRHQNPNIRYLAYEAIAKADPVHVEQIKNGLKDENYAVVCVCVEAFDKFGDKDAVAMVFKTAEQSDDCKNAILSAIVDMCATTLFISPDIDSEAVLKITEKAAASKNRYIIEKFRKACKKIENPELMVSCQKMMKNVQNLLPEIKGKILVVDDSPTMLKLYQSILPKYGYEVDIASDGLGASKKIETHPSYDVLISDLNMPNRNGTELVTHVRASLFSDIPILMVSTEEMVSQRKEAEAAGADAFLAKPFTVSSLLQAVESLIKNT